jgi:hypothetical protein
VDGVRYLMDYSTNDKNNHSENVSHFGTYEQFDTTMIDGEEFVVIPTLRGTENSNLEQSLIESFGHNEDRQQDSHQQSSEENTGWFTSIWNVLPGRNRV